MKAAFWFVVGIGSAGLACYYVLGPAISGEFRVDREPASGFYITVAGIVYVLKSLEIAFSGGNRDAA